MGVRHYHDGWLSKTRVAIWPMILRPLSVNLTTRTRSLVHFEAPLFVGAVRHVDDETHSFVSKTECDETRHSTVVNQ